MRRLVLLQVITLWSVATSLFASELRSELRSLTEGMRVDNCSENMGKISQRLDQLKVEDYQAQISSWGHEVLLDELFGFKLKIHEKLRSFYDSQELFKDCSVASRGALSAIRTTEDYIHENYYQLNRETIVFPDHSFGADNPHVKKNPEYSDFNFERDLKSGDVLLTRGNAYTSAAIASLGEFDTQFSHMSLVYRDEQGKLWTVEAHIEVGSFVRPLQDHINDKNYRTMVFRYENEEVARKAAEYIFHKVKKASDTTGNILYDFGFDQDNNEALFCSEIVSYAFSHVTQGQIQMPLFRSQLFVRKPDFVRTLEITANSSFIPADIEVDPRFKVISEWRDAAKTRENLQKDAVIHAMYKWNDELGYRMIQASSGKSLLYRNIAWPLRRVPFLKKYFKDKMPLNMTRKLIGYFGVLESVGEHLQKRLVIEDEKAALERGIPLLRSEKASVLEEIRLDDLKTRKKRLHKMYRPRKKS